MKTISLKSRNFSSLRVFAFFFSIILAVTSCRGDDGEVGPQGPEGPAGTANVTSVLFTSPSWSGEQINISVPQITSDIYNNGAVIAYMEFSSVSGVYYHVPGLVVNNTAAIRVYQSVGTMRFNILDPDGSIFSGTKPTVSAIKVIIIPAGSTVNGKMANAKSIDLQLKEAGVNINNYEEVKAYFNL